MVPGSIPRIILSSTIKSTSLFKANKNHNKLFTTIKLILFIGVIFLLYKQLSDVDPKQWSELSLENSISLILAITLVVPNIWLAYLKWKVTLSAAKIESTLESRKQSFFAGIVTGMLTPNMVGNFLGRLYYFDKSHRGTITGLTLLSNYAQFLISLSFGLLSIILIDEFYLVIDAKQVLFYIAIFTVIAYAIYFYIEYFLKIFWKKSISSDLVKALKNNGTYRLKILVISAFRFIIFTSQFVLMLNAFGEEINSEMMFAIWQVYLITMIAPSLILGKVGVKESIALFILTGIGYNEFGILFSSILIWFINSLTPALYGLIICRKRQLI
mgnify:CR=1 FL=1